MSFQDYIADITKGSNGFFYGIWWKTNPQIFFIVDKEFNIAFEMPAFNELGRLTNEVNHHLELCGIQKDTTKLLTDNDLETLKARIKKDYKIYKKIFST